MTVWPAIISALCALLGTLAGFCATVRRQAADMAQISSRLDVKKALEDVHRKMKQKKVNRYQVLFRGMQRAAAILFIPLMVSWSILYWTRIKKRYI